MALTGGTNNWTYTDPAGWDAVSWDDTLDPMSVDAARSLFWAAMERAEAVRMCTGDGSALQPLRWVLSDLGPFRTPLAETLGAVRDSIAAMAGKFVNWETSIMDLEALWDATLEIQDEADRIDAQSDILGDWYPTSLSFGGLCRELPELRLGIGPGSLREEARPFMLAAREALMRMRRVECNLDGAGTDKLALGSGATVADARVAALADEHTIGVSQGWGSAFQVRGYCGAYWDGVTDSYWNRDLWRHVATGPRYMVHPQDAGTFAPVLCFARVSHRASQSIAGVPTTRWTYNCPLGWSEGVGVEEYAAGQIDINPVIDVIPPTPAPPPPGSAYNGVSTEGFAAEANAFADFGTADGFRFTSHSDSND